MITFLAGIFLGTVCGVVVMAVRNGNIQESVPLEDYEKCILEWLQREVEVSYER